MSKSRALPTQLALLRRRPLLVSRLVSAVRPLSAVIPLLGALSLLGLLSSCRTLSGRGRESGSTSAPAPFPLAERGEKTRVVFRAGGGTRVWLEEDHLAPVVALQLWYQAGQADEPVTAMGALDLLVAWMVEGPRSGGRPSVAETVRAWGGSVHGWTSPDATVFEWLVPSTQAAAAAALAAELVQQPPDFADVAALERFRREILVGLGAREGEPLARATAATITAAFSTHPYGRSSVARAEGLRSLNGPSLREAHRQLLQPGRLSWLMAGDFDRSALRLVIASALGGSPTAAAAAGTHPGEDGRPVARPQEPARTSPRAWVVARPPHEGDGAVVLAFPLPPAAQEDAWAAAWLGAALAGDAGSRLPSALVRNRRLASGVDTIVLTGRDPGLLLLRIRLAAGAVDEAIQVACDEIGRLGREELRPDEVTRARLILSRDDARAVGTLEGYVHRLGWSATMLGEPEDEGRLRAARLKMTASSLRRAAARILAPEKTTVVALVPDGEARGQRERLAATEARLAALVGDTPARLDRLFAEHPPKPETLRRARGGVTVARRVLPSGVRAVIISDHALPQVYARAVWSGGLRVEDARDFGAAQLIARVLAQGPRSLSPEETASRLSAAGGRLEGFADEDTMGVSLDLLPESADAGLALFVESLRHPRFSDEDVEGAKRLLIDRRRADERHPAEIARRAFFEALWPRHPYRLDPRGSTISLAALDRRRLLDHYRREYPLGSLTLLVAGDVDAEQLLSQLGRWFGDKRDQGPVLLANTLPAMPPAPVAGEPTVAAPVEIFRTTDRDECHVFLGARAPARRDPDAAAAQVLWEVLAGAQGRLRRSLAELAPLASFRVVWFGALEGGAMGIDLVAPRDKLPDVVATLRAEIAHFLTEGADPRDVARARTWLVGRRSLGLEDRGQVFTAMARDEAFGLGLEAYRSLVDRLTTVEAADVSRVARALLPAEKLILTVVQPSEGKPRSP